MPPELTDQDRAEVCGRYERLLQWYVVRGATRHEAYMERHE